MKREARSEKIIVLGIDGMDPKLTKKYIDMGLMPNTKKFIEAGAAREDLVLLGGQPTVTPPMWTTLATGAYPMTHGITGFNGQHPMRLDKLVYNMDSRRCKAEQLWNVFAEAGKKNSCVALARFFLAADQRQSKFISRRRRITDCG